MHANQGLRAHALGWHLGRTALDSDDPRPFFFRLKEYSGHSDHLLLSRRRSGDHVVVLRVCGRDAFSAVPWPVRLKVLRRAVPRALTATAPHRRGSAAQRTRMVNGGNRIHM